MAIVDFSRSPILSVLLAPAQALAAWFIPSQRAADQRAVPLAVQHASHQLALPFASGATTVRRRSAAAANSGKTNASNPVPSRLRVVREFDSSVSPACAGRMVISGRMADVCAELERMTQRETAVQ
ncbi:MAG: hypothetical protein A3E79_11445 [Burkholderiales bacterium RIFCSPHIGHO2_12_FULL_61_11]|nr:MAG: hypothetical protein A3E79_11445 [Burkholderiales bacterium RIFCSPHIGHO2_12_FULL_61_11]